MFLGEFEFISLTFPDLREFYDTCAKNFIICPRVHLYSKVQRDFASTAHVIGTACKARLGLTIIARHKMLGTVAGYALNNHWVCVSKISIMYKRF